MVGLISVAAYFFAQSVSAYLLGPILRCPFFDFAPNSWINILAISIMLCILMDVKFRPFQYFESCKI